MKENSQSISQIQHITLIGMGGNVILAVIKFVFGVLGQSQAVIVDGVHSLSDLTTDLAVYFGVKVWSKPADEDHPYGHRRIETIITVGIGIALLAVALGLSIHALTTIRGEKITQPGWIALGGALISIVSKELLYRWTLRVGKKVRSTAVLANAWHHRSDALSSIPVAIAVAAAAIFPSWSFLDRIGAFVVSLFILKEAVYIIRGTLCEIADTGASRTYKEKIKDIVIQTQGVQSFHRLRTRRMGSGWYVDLHIQVDPNITVKDGHNISEMVKSNLFAREDLEVLDVLVHLEPKE